VRYREPGERAGAQKHTSFPTKKAADAFAAKVEHDKATGNYLDPARGQILFADYVAEWMGVQVLRPGTLDQYTRNLRNHALPVFGQSPIAAITRPMVQGFVKRLLDSHLAPSTVHNIYGVFAGIMRAAGLDNRLPRTPCVSIRLPEIPKTRVRILTADQVFALADAMRRATASPSCSPTAPAPAKAKLWPPATHASNPASACTPSTARSSWSIRAPPASAPNPSSARPRPKPDTAPSPGRLRPGRLHRPR
jgi:hypothetical protein